MALISTSHTSLSLLQAPRHINAHVNAMLSWLWTWERTRWPLLKTCLTSVEVASIEIKFASALENKVWKKKNSHTRNGQVVMFHSRQAGIDCMHFYPPEERILHVLRPSAQVLSKLATKLLIDRHRAWTWVKAIKYVVWVLNGNLNGLKMSCSKGLLKRKMTYWWWFLLFIGVNTDISIGSVKLLLNNLTHSFNPVLLPASSMEIVEFALGVKNCDEGLVIGLSDNNLHTHGNPIYLSMVSHIIILIQ